MVKMKALKMIHLTMTLKMSILTLLQTFKKLSKYRNKFRMNQLRTIIKINNILVRSNKSKLTNNRLHKNRPNK